MKETARKWILQSLHDKMVLNQFEQDAVPLIKNLYHPKNLIIFGSRAQNNVHDGSDIDVILVSEKFATIPFVLRMTDVLLKVPFPVHVDYICYTPDEYSRLIHTSAIIRDAIKGPIIALV